MRFASVGETVAFQAPTKRVGQIQDDVELSISVFCLSFTHFPPHTPTAFDEDSKAAAVTNEMGYRKSSDAPMVSDQNNISRLSRPQATHERHDGCLVFSSCKDVTIVNDHSIPCIHTPLLDCYSETSPRSLIKHAICARFAASARKSCGMWPGWPGWVFCCENELWCMCCC